MQRFIYFIKNIVLQKLFLKAALGIFIITGPAFSQENVGIGTSTPDSSAVLELSIQQLASPKGFLLPRLTTAQRNAIILPATTLMIYNTTTLQFEYNIGTPAIPLWTGLQSGGSSMAWSLTGNTNTDPAQNFIGTTDAKDLVFKTDGGERLRITSTGNLLLKSEATASELRFFSPYGSGLYYTGFKAGLQSTNITYTLPLAQGASGYVLSNDGTGILSWVAGGGSVTSVGLSMPSIFTVSNSPVISSGTLTATLVSQNRNTFFAGPVSGAAGVPTFRIIDTADIPALDMSKINGTLPVTKGGTGVTAITGLVSGNGTSGLVGRAIIGTADQITVTDGNGAVANPTIAIATNPVLSGTASITIPKGTSAERPATPVNGMMRYNTSTNRFEYYENSVWVNGGSGAVGPGTANYIPKFTDATTIGDSKIFDNGTSVGINTTTGDLLSSAALQVNSTTQGFLPPRVTNTERDAINPPTNAAGLIIYQTDSNTVTNEGRGLYTWNGTIWRRVTVTNLSELNGAATVIVVRKTANQSRTTYGDDNHLLFPLLASESWSLEGMIIAQNNTSQGGITFGFEAPLGATFVSGYHSNQDNASGFIGGVLEANNITVSFKTNASSSYLVIYVKVLVTNGTTAGNLKLRWNSFNAGTTTVKAGSYLTGARATQ